MTIENGKPPSSNLVMDERLLLVGPRLACLVGLNEAILIQQIHYWLVIFHNSKQLDHFKGGRFWVYNSYEEWREENFPFWSVGTIKRIVYSLEKQGLLATHEEVTKIRGGTRKWYTIDYEKLKQLENSDQVDQGSTTNSDQSDHSSAENSDQSDPTTRINLIRPPDQSDPSSTLYIRAGAFSETSTETSTETSKDIAQPDKSVAPAPQSDQTVSDVVEEPPVSTPAPKARKPRPRDLWIDTIAECVFKVKPGTPLGKRTGARCGTIKSEVLTTYPDLTPEKFRQIVAWKTPYISEDAAKIVKMIGEYELYHKFTKKNNRHYEEQEQNRIWAFAG